MANLSTSRARTRVLLVGKSAHCASTVYLQPSSYSYPFSCSPATPDVISQAQYALDIKQKALPLYEKAFDIEYPLPKLDTLVANDFGFGAMENWVIVMRLTSCWDKLD